MKISKKWMMVFPLIALALLASACAGRFQTGISGSSSAQDTAQLTRGPLNVTVSAIGNVRARQSAQVVWQTSGNVGEVLVSLGQKVSANETLAELDRTSLPQSILQAQVDVINAQNALDDLYHPSSLSIAQAESAVAQAQEKLEALGNPSVTAIAQAELAVTNAQDKLEALRNPSDTAIAQAELAVITAEDAVAKAQRDFNNLTYGRGNAEQINLARANYLLAQERVDQMQGIYNRTPGHSNEDAAKALALSNLEGAKRDLNTKLAILNWYEGEPTPEELNEKQTNLALAQAKLADDQKTLEDLKNPSAEDIALAQGNLGDAQQALEDLKNPSPEDVALAEANVSDAQEKLVELKNGPTQDQITIAETRLVQAQAAVNQAFLSAPFDGVITEIHVLRGDLVSNGKQAFRIDDLSNLYIDLQVSEIDIYQLEIGQPVSIVFDAILDKTYHGEVAEIGQIGASSQGIVNFTASVHLTDPDADIKPGMTAEANIQVAQVADVLQVPSRFILDDNGKRFVLLVAPDGLKQMYIQVGLTSDTASEVISTELKEGDTISARPEGLAGFMVGNGGGMP